MSYELAQNLLTALINFIAIAGITGIIAHAFYTQHKRFMDAYCPPIATHTPDTRDAEALAPEPEQPEETTVTPAEINELAKELVTEAMPATDAALEALKEVQQPTLAEDLGLVPPSDWGKVQEPAARKPRSRKPAQPKAPAAPRSRRKTA
jgi:hypothetical protein